MMSKAAFRDKLREYLRHSGYQQQRLAAEIGLTPGILSRKLNGTDGKYLTDPEIKSLIKILAEWKIICRKAEAIELLTLAGLQETNFGPTEWSNPPLAALEVEKASPETLYKAAPIATLPKLSGLPAPLTGFIGREQEVQQVQGLLQKPEVRLLTLTGPGGIGKTRLALEAANGLLTHFEEGVYFLSLDSINEASLIPSALARLLDLKESGKQTLPEILKSWLQSRQTLLIFDNFEHLLDGAGLVKELLSAAPCLKILVTSRAMLHLYGEHEFSVPPLALPNLKQLPPPDGLAQIPAVSLFVQRAALTRHDFALNQDNAPAVAEICTRLEGLPLAIELAAARIKLFTPAKILNRLVNSLQELAGGAPDLPPRQRSLYAAIDWSYNLLSEDEKLLFTRLAVFTGSYTAATVEQVCNTDKALQLDIIIKLLSLLDKSLLRNLDGPEDETEFVMLDIIRQYALERLTQRAESAALKKQHALYYLDLAEKAMLGSQAGPEQSLWLNRLEREHNNLRAGLSWALNPAITEADEQFEIGLRLARALNSFWIKHGHLSEGRQWLETSLAHPAAAFSRPALAQLQAELLRGAGTIAYLQGDYAHSRRRYEAAEVVWREMGDSRHLLAILNNLAVVENAEGHLVRAKMLLEESLTLARELADKPRLSASLNNLGSLLASQGDYVQATSLYEESLKLLEEIGDRGMQAQPLSNLGLLAQKQGNYRRANQLLETRLAIGREMGDRQGIANALNGLGIVACQQDCWEKARQLYLESLAIWQEIGYKQGVAAVKNNLGTVACKQINYPAAADWFNQSLNLYQALGNQNGVAHALVGLANVSALTSQTRQAVRRLSFAQNLLTKSGTLLDPLYQHLYDQTLALTHSALTQADFEAEWQEASQVYQV